MRTILLILLCLNSILGKAQTDIKSDIYHRDQPGILFNGANHPMKSMKMELIRLNAGSDFNHKTNDGEQMIIAKTGSIILDSKSIHQTLTPRSVAVIVKRNKYKLRNTSANSAWFYVISYQAKDPSKVNDTATTFVRLYEDVAFHAHERGGVRSYFDKKTSQTNRLELHMTTLNAGLKSHDPHTHKSEEMIIMIDGDTKMLIGEKEYSAFGDGVYYVESMLPHGIQNVNASSPCSYFAFQWE